MIAYIVYCSDEYNTDEYYKEYTNKKEALKDIKEQLKKDWWRVDLHTEDIIYGETITKAYRN